MRQHIGLLPALLILLSGCSILEVDARQTYVENRCEAATQTSPHGTNHCQDARSISQYQQEYQTYRRQYQQTRNR
ncbi:hypothetical protein CF392_03225 [Tamilnaduibacter salinus]|uniref:Lipoprotein n=1 Tax=Tamilnaduibacter salinus TaxID=1484056 RepID=A0A2A2I4A7_9GAMM|nr:hypothetical protein [Tamilnaduibacter salinus]PAV26841.1 hypothetical protein CF392_03225 [Tamilnaduibacter salinus]